jgi:hypothetical protein
MIYTSYEMIQDCRAGKTAGWTYFTENYLPVVRRIVAHYGGGDVNRVMECLQRNLFSALSPMPERQFVAELRQQVLQVLLPEQDSTLDLETLARAIEPLTVVEKKAVWMETMRYDANATARMLRMDPQTVERIRERGQELIRSSQDRWSRTILVDNGTRLGRAAAAQSKPDCIAMKSLLDIIDGRITWARKEAIERHVAACLHCVDQFSRMHECCELIRK